VEAHGIQQTQNHGVQNEEEPGTFGAEPTQDFSIWCTWEKEQTNEQKANHMKVWAQGKPEQGD